MTQIFLWLTVLLLSGSTGPPLDFQSIAPQLTPPTLTPVADVPASSQFIHSIETRPQSAIEAGLFHDDIGDEYVVFVNRMCNNADGSPADPDTFWVHLSGDSTYLVEDVLISHQSDAGPVDGLFYAYGDEVPGMPTWQVILGPGEGRLFRLTPGLRDTIPGGVWRGSVTVASDVVLPADQQLTISTITVAPVNVAIADGVTLFLDGTVNASATLFMAAENVWYGMVLSGPATFDDCEFSGAYRMIDVEQSFCQLTDCTFMDYSYEAIRAFDATVWVNDSFLFGDPNHYNLGIEAIGGQLQVHRSNLVANTIGVQVYDPPDSPHLIEQTTIENGDYGVLAEGGAVLHIEHGSNIWNNDQVGLYLLSKAALTLEYGVGYEDTLHNHVENNGAQEIYFYSDAALNMADGENYVADDAYTPGTPDEYLVERYHPYIFDESRRINLEWNNWGNNYPETRFHPDGFERFDIDPVWPGEGGGRALPPPAALYQTALTAMQDQQFDPARSGFEQVVSSYPESELALLSLEQLLVLEKTDRQDFGALRAYYENLPARQDNELIARITDHLITHTHAAEANYQAAIDRLETIIADPPTLADSVFAVIDVGWLYLRQADNGGAAPMSRDAAWRPQSVEAHSQNTRTLLNTLGLAIPRPDEDSASSATGPAPHLDQNFPNPFNPTTTIRYNLPQAGPVCLGVYNLAGQRVRTIVDRTQQPGAYEVTWDGRSDDGRMVASGIYLYRLDINGMRVHKRMILLK